MDNQQGLTVRHFLKVGDFLSLASVFARMQSKPPMKANCRLKHSTNRTLIQSLDIQGVVRSVAKGRKCVWLRRAAATRHHPMACTGDIEPSLDARSSEFSREIGKPCFCVEFSQNFSAASILIHCRWAGKWARSLWWAIWHYQCKI